MHMLERLVVLKPFDDIATATGFFETFARQMQSLGYSVEPAQSSGGIGTQIIGINVDYPSPGENFGNVQLVIGDGQMTLIAAGNIFAMRSIIAVAQGLGLSLSDAFNLAASAIYDETENGRPLLIAIVPNAE